MAPSIPTATSSSAAAANSRAQSLWPTPRSAAISNSLCTFDDALNAIWLQLGGALTAFSDDKTPTRFKDVHLEAANIAGLTFLGGSMIDGVLNGAQMTAATVDLLSAGDATSKFKSVSLVGAKLTGSLNMAGATVEGAVDMGSLQIDCHVGAARRRPLAGPIIMIVSLIGAKIGGNLDMTSAHVDGKLNLAAVQIGGDLLLCCCATGLARRSRTSFWPRRGFPVACT